MAKQYTVIVTSTEAQDLRTHKVAQNSGDKGKALRIKAKAGETYQLVEVQPGQAQSYAPQQVKVKRVGKDLVITFEGGSRPDIIIEGYYDVMAKDHKGLIGLAEDGSFYEYIPEDPHPLGMVQLLPEGGQDVAMALGAGEIIAPAAAAIAAFPLLGALGLLGGAAAAAYVINKDDPVTNNGISGKLSNQSDNIDGGTVIDNRTRDNTPTLTGTVPVGSTAVVTVNGVDYPATVNPDGTWTASIDKTNLPDGTYYPILKVTQKGVTTPHNITPFTIDTTPPSIAITSNAAALASGETATITFTLSEAVADFAEGDVTVTGGKLSNFQRDPSNPLKYTATFTPNSTGTSATIQVDNTKFSDAVANFNTDGAEANNTVTLTTNATVTGALDQTATNANGTPNDSGAKGDNLTNDNTPTLKGKVPQGSTAKVLINGVEYPVTVNPDGTWSFTNPTNLPDGTYTPQLIVTPPGSTTPNAPVPLTPFTIDTVPPSIIVTAPTNSLVAGQTTPITFTLSEPVADFALTDIAVTGGTLSNLVQSATDPKVWTATFTPASTGTSATIRVDSGKFSDAAANFNTDGTEANNTVTLTTNAAVSGGLSPASDNSTGIPNDNTTNDATPELAGKVAPGSSVKVKIKDKDGNVVGEGTGTVDANGNWTYTQPDNLPDGTYTPEVTVNGGTPVPLKPFVIDTLPPTVIVTAPVSTLAAGASTTVTFTLTEAATNLTDADFVVTGGTLGALQQSATNPLVYTATFTSTNGGAGAVSIANNAFSDAAGNLNKDTYVNPASTGATYESNNTWAFNTGNPTPTPVDSKSTALTIDRITGDNILTATEQGTATITVTGKVTGKFVAGDIVTLTVGGVSRNVAVAADGTYQLPIETAKFVADSDLKIEGTVTGTGGSAATAAQQYTKETSDVITKTALSIDPVTADNIIGSAESAGNIPVTGKVTGKFSNGDIVTLTVNGKTFTGPAAADGTFSINVPAADLLADTNTTVDGTVSGTGGTTATAMQDYGVDPNINPVPGPSVKTALTINAITGDNLINSTEQGATSTIVTGKVTGTFAANDTVTLLVNGKTYTGPAAADGSYSISVPTADLVADADSKIEGSVTGTGGQLATAAQDYALDANAPTAPTKTALTIDPIAADNMISDAENTGSINVTGTVMGKFVAGDKVTITVNGKPFTGVADANGKFTIPVPADDLTADSDTQVDGTVTGTGGTVATALQNYGINTTSPSPVPPASLKTALTIDSITGDNILSTADTAQTNTIVTGKVTGAFATDDTVTLTLNGQQFTGKVTSLGNYSISIPTANFTADADTKIEGTVTGTGGSLATAAQDYTVEDNLLAGKTTALTIDKVTADNIIDISETGGSINVTGKVTGKFAPNDTVTLTINGKTYTGQAAADGSFSIPVLASDLVADADTTVDGTVTGTGGTTAAAMQNYGVDSAVPAPSLKTALTINPITDDNLLNSAEQNTSTNPTTTVTGKVTGTFVADDIVTLVINGHNYTAPVAADGSYSINTVATSDLVADADKKIEGSVTGSNGGQYATAAQNYALDANAPTNPTQTTLTIDPVTADNIIGSTESTGNINVTGKVMGKFSEGDVVTLTINGHTYSTTAGADGTYSVPVPASDLLADIDTTITGAVHGTGGTDAAAMQNYGVDANVNPVQPGDTTPPTIIVERTNPGLSSLDANSTETITFTLSEASTTFDGSDIVVTGGTLSGFTPVAGSGTAATGYTKYTAVFTPAANSSGTATVGVASGKFADNAGNNNQDTYVNPAPNGATYESNNQVSLAFNTTSANPVDTDKPTIQITIDKASLATGQSATLTFILSEASTDFTLADIDVFGGNGTVSNLQVVPGSNGAQYTATYTAGNSAGTDRIGVLSGKFSDAAGNQNADTYLGSATGTAPSGATGEANNWVSLTNTGANDTTAPTVAVSRMGSGTVGSAGETIVFTLSEASTDFTSADVTVSGGTLTNWTPVAGSNGTQYTATFVPTSGANGTATIGVLSNKFSDAAANFNKDTYTNPATGTDVYEANNQITLGYDTRTNPAPADTTAPTIAITASVTTLNVGQTATVTFVLSEASTDFTAADVAVTGGTLSNFQVVAGSGNTEYTATFTPTAGAQGTGSVHVDSNAFRDAANNYNADGAEANNTVNFITNNGALPADTTPPTIAITSNQAALTAGQTATITFTLSEASTDFVVGDVEVSGGTLSNFTGSGTTYTATFTPATNSTTNGVIKVASGKFSDASSNLNKDTYTNPATGTDVYEANNIVTLTVNTNASLALVNDTAAAVEAGVVNGNTAVTGTNPSGNVLTNDTGTTGSTAVTAIAAGSTTGTVGSALAGQFGSLTLNADGSYVYTVNNSNATVNALPAGSTLTDVFTYSVGGQTANLTVTITGTNDAPVYVANSLVNQTVDIGSALSYQFPTTAFTDVDTGDTATYTATLADGSALPSWLTFNAATRTFTGTPPAGTAPGTISVKVIDTDSGLATANGLFNIVINAAGDTTPPTILVERANPASSLDAVGTETIIFTLSEASTTFDGSDIAVTGGTLSNFTPVTSSGTAATGYTKYTAVFTPAANSNGTATIGVASGKFTDNAGNANQDTYLTPAPTGAVTELAANNTNLVSVVYDTRSTNPADNDKPTIQVSVDKTSIANGQTATLTFILSEASADFTLADIDVISGGGTVTNLLPVAGSNGVQYTATYTAGSTAGNVLIGVDAGKFADAAGNINNDTYKGNATGTTAVGGTAAEANNWVQLTNTGASDTTAPTVVVTRMGSGTVGSAGETVVFTLSEASSDFVVGDVTVTGGTLTNFTAVLGSNGTQYSATFVPTTGTNGTATIGVLSGKFSDAASNLNKDTYTNPATGTDVYEANNQVVLDYDARTSPAPADTTAPTIAISASATTLAANATATVTFTLSEASTDFNQADVVVTGGTLSNWTQVNATEYTATFTPTAGAQGTGSVHVDSNKFSDAALNYNTDGADANNTVNFITNNGVLPTDTTPPTIVVSSNQASLSSGQTATITFTLSEASTDFVQGDVTVTGGTLSNWTAVSGTVYTATFTPTANSTVNGVISVASNKFSDAAANFNVDGAEANNTVTLTVNTTVASSLALINDTATAVESGVTSGNTAVTGTNPSGNVLTNDTAATSVTGIAAGSTTGSVGTALQGLYGTLTLQSNGSYVYTLNNSNATVNALQVSSSLTDVFTYTATDGTTSKTANLSVTINGTDDAPTVAVALVDQAGTIGTALGYTFDSGTFADVDTADTKTYTATLADGSPLPSWLTFNASTRTFSGTPPGAGTTSVKVTCTDSQGATANDIFDIVVTAPVVSSVKTALTINPVTGDNVILNSENTGSITLTGKVSGTFAAGDTVTLVINGTNYTATAAADGSYSVAVLASDLAADSDKKVEGAVVGTGGELATAAQTYVLESTDTPTQTALAIDPITADNVVIANEANGSGNVAVTGKVTGVFAAGDTVTLTINGHTYTATAAANGTFSVDVLYTDLTADADTTVDGTVTGTGGTAATATQNYALVDETPPTIAVTRSGTGTMTAAETITFTLSEASTDFTSADVDVTGGTLSGFSGSGMVYTALFTPASNTVGTATVGVKAGTFSDAAGNQNKDTYEPFISGTVMEANNIVNMNVITDVTPPTIAISQITSPVTGAVTVTFTLSEASTDFSANDVFVTAGTGSLSNWTADASSGTATAGYKVYTATFTPTANSSGSVTIGVAAGKFHDAAGLVNKDTYTQATEHVSGEVIEDNNNKTDFTYNTDVTPPTVVITGPSGAVNGPVTITFTLSEASSDFALSAGDITVSGGGTLSNFQQSASNPLVYTATYTPPATSSGSATIDIASGKFSDTAGNFNADGGDVNNHLPISYDTVTPTVEVTRATSNTLGGTGAPFTTETITFTLSEASSDFTQSSVTVAGGTLSGWTAVSSTVYTATFTPASGAAGTGTIGVAAGKFHDAAGNANADTYLPGQGANTQAEGTAGANQVSVAYDTQAPSQTVSFGSMTKDSDISTGANNDWQTADTSAGRLVSGFLSAPLAAGETLKVYSNGTLIGNAVVNAAGTAWEITDTTGYSADWTYTAKVMDAAGNPGNTATQAVTKLAAVSATTNGTSGGETLAYSTGVIDTFAGDDTITVASTAIQTDLTTGKLINGGAGIDTLQLAAATTLNLEALTTNQTVKNIQEVEIFKMQGTSTLRMSANDVLSLGGANATTMAPFSFASTNQVADAATGTTATGSTSSTGKVQMVIQGTGSDTLKLDALLTDATTSNSVLGNAGLSGTWDYKGTVQVGLTTYKVYNHSTTNAQVLVDVPVIVNAIDPIKITTIDDALSGTTGTTGSNDTGTSATDFVTLDPTLVFKGTTPNLAAGEQVKFQLLNSSGQPVTLANGQTFAYLAPSGNVWTYDNTGSTLANGNYTIVATIVDSGGNVVSTYGSLGVDTHPLTIDTTLPTIVVTRATSNTLSAGQTETITFTLSEAATDFTSADVTVTNGTLINFSGSGTSYTATFVPASGSGTGTIKVDSTKFSDLAGNFNADGADTAAGVTNIVSVAYQALPTQTATFSSMTKDSGLLAGSSTNNHDWLTNDGSAGRLVSGTLDAPLTAGQTLKVYANGVLIGDAVVNGQAWEITDLTGYTAGWTYTAKVVDSANNAGPVTTQVVNADMSEVAPVITSVTDSGNASIANNGTTANTLSTVSGTGNAGDTVYLYDNTGTNLVGTTTVASNGTWSISGLASNAGVGAGTNVFSARQVDALGNESVLSNLWTVNANGVNQFVNGDFSGGNTGFSSSATYTTGSAIAGFTNQYAIKTITSPLTDGATSANLTTNANSGSTSYTYGTWSKQYISVTSPRAAGFGNPDGTMTGLVMVGQVSYAQYGYVIWKETVSVVAGKTYVFKFDYGNGEFLGTDMGTYIDGAYIQVANNIANSFESGHFTATYVATTTKSMDISVVAQNNNTSTYGDFLLDNFTFAAAAPAVDNTLTAGGTPPFTSVVDGVSTAMTYTGGVADMLAGDDVLNIGTNAQTLLATSGNLINGSTGIDTLKLAAGTTLDLTALTNNQTVKSIEQVEVFQLQGSSTLTLSANDVLSLGQTNAFGTASTKVQFMIKGTSTDQVSLQNLLSDGVGGNAGLAGMWTKEASTVTVSGTGAGTYNVYTHSTTGAQVLISTAVPDSSVTLATSPLVLDLNGNGIETTTLAAGAVFDLDANGTAERAAWVAGGDGLLVRDLDGNGLITSGAELFGSGTTLANGAKALDGFAALAGLDSNGDGTINASDAAFGQLQVWVDANGDGHTDAGELRSLADLGIASLGLQSQASDLQNNGNAVGLLGSYTTTDGAEHVLADVWLQNQSLPVLDLTQVLSDAQTATANLSNGQAELLRLNVSDVLAVQANASGQHVVQITGDAQDVVDLSDLFADGHTTGTWGQNGTVTQNGQTFNVYSYSGDASLQVLIDQHLQHVTLS